MGNLLAVTDDKSQNSIIVNFACNSLDALLTELTVSAHIHLKVIKLEASAHQPETHEFCSIFLKNMHCNTWENTLERQKQTIN